MSGWRFIPCVLGTALISGFTPACSSACVERIIRGNFLVTVEDVYTHERICNAKVSVGVPGYWPSPAVAHLTFGYDGKCAYVAEGVEVGPGLVHVCVRVDGYIPLQVQVAVPIESTDDACADEYVTQNPIFVWAKVEPDLNPPDAGPVDAGTG